MSEQISFYEIRDRYSDEVIQRIAVLTRSEIETIQANGYQVAKCALSKSLYSWLLDPTEARP